MFACVCVCLIYTYVCVDLDAGGSSEFKGCATCGGDIHSARERITQTHVNTLLLG